MQMCDYCHTAIAFTSPLNFFRKTTPVHFCGQVVALVHLSWPAQYGKEHAC
eukprot:c5341_g1_i1 orf=3-152(-)